MTDKWSWWKERNEVEDVLPSGVKYSAGAHDLW